MTINTRNADSVGLAITSPENGASVAGVVPVTLLASGGACTPRAFTLSVDGTQVFAKDVIVDTATYAWDTSAVPSGAHTLTSEKGVGVQVLGFGDNTSFQVPAGLDLKIIAPPPSPK